MEIILYFSDHYNKVLLFEPNLISFKLLTVNTYFLQNVEVLNCGLSDAKKHVNMSILKGNVGGSNSYINYNSGINHQIKLVRLDDQNIDYSGKIALIKIDVEGMENKVLKGAENTIMKNLPIILFELWSSSFENGRSNTIKF